MPRPITIIVPVFNGASELPRCLESLARCRPPGSDILLHDDASTDPRVAPILAAFAATCSRVVVHAAPSNQGFVGACNAAAAAAAPGADLLFLNSDTELTAGAIEEMAVVLESTGAALCCPMSSNATFLSLPRFQQANELPLGWSAEDMASRVREAAGERRAMPIPTAVGFCMLVRRDAWDRWGPFDAAFGSGYGEDDDLGQRVLAGGDKLVAALRAYVWHRGSASFGVSAQVRERRGANGQLLLSRWPDYATRVRAFCRSNPFRPMHERLWHALLSAPDKRERHVLHLVPRWELAGSLREHVLGLARATRHFANHTVLVPTPDRGAWLDAIDFETEAGLRVTGLVDLPSNLGRFLGASPATHVHVHRPADWRTEPLQSVVRGFGLPLQVSDGDAPAPQRCADWYRSGVQDPRARFAPEAPRANEHRGHGASVAPSAPGHPTDDP